LGSKFSSVTSQILQHVSLQQSFARKSLVLSPLQEMLERQLEYERVRLEAESRKACLESQEKVGKRSEEERGW